MKAPASRIGRPAELSPFIDIDAIDAPSMLPMLMSMEGIRPYGAATGIDTRRSATELLSLNVHPRTFATESKPLHVVMNLDAFTPSFL
jgi:hypothetical protein